MRRQQSERRMKSGSKNDLKEMMVNEPVRKGTMCAPQRISALGEDQTITGIYTPFSSQDCTPST